MDIFASLASPPVASTQVGEVSAASVSGADSSSFSQALSKASEPVAVQEPAPIKAPAVTGTLAQPPATPIKTPAVSSTSQAASVEVDPAPALAAIPEPTLETAIPEPVELPKPALTARPATQLNQHTTAREDAETDDDLTVDISPVSEELAQVADSDSTDDSDSALQDIRQRMDLIESAGQLDMASVSVVPPAPVQIMAVASGSSDVLGDTQQSPDETTSLVSTDLSSSDQASAAPEVAADEYASTLLDPANTVQTVAGSFASQTKQSDSTVVDSQTDSSISSDPQGGLNLAALALNTTSLISSETNTSESPLLSATVGTTRWQDGLGQQVIDMFKRGDKQVDLRLHPADLGPLSISLNLSDSNTQAQFQSAHASVRAAVEQALPQLREALASQGITLGQASVGDDSSRSSGQPRRDVPADSNGSLTVAGENPLAIDEPIAQSVMVRDGGVDLYL